MSKQSEHLFETLVDDPMEKEIIRLIIDNKEPDEIIEQMLGDE